MSATRTETPSDSLDSTSFNRFAAFIQSELGIKMPPGKVSMLQSRLQRRLRALSLSSIDEYMDRLFSSDGSELIHFIDAVTTNKTDFFREPRHFEFLYEMALPELDPNPNAPWQLKLWCAGCSSGDEPYTLAMLLAEFAARRSGFDFSILATDISTSVLQIAQRAVYPLAKIEPVPAALRQRYLLRSRDTAERVVRVVPQLRQRVRFRRLNFMDTDYGISESFDAIFFRNVMIYFDKPTQERVVNKLCRNLKPGGYLFVGHSESLAGLDIPVSLVQSAIYRRH